MVQKQAKFGYFEFFEKMKITGIIPGYGSIIMPSIKEIHPVVSEEWLRTDGRTDGNTDGHGRFQYPPSGKPVGDNNLVIKLTLSEKPSLPHMPTF